MKIAEFGLKCVQTARYELILGHDEAIWLRIIFEPLFPPKAVKDQKNQKNRTKFVKLPRLQYVLVQERIEDYCGCVADAAAIS